MTAYLKATRHPWACLLFLLPLLAAYEGGVVWLGDDSGSLRNGADVWFRSGLGSVGVTQKFAAPVAIVLVLLAWTWWRWEDRPQDAVTTWFGMAFESVVFAVVLWQVSRNFGPILDHFGVKLQIEVGAASARQVVTYVGAGIYEELLFRLGLFVGLCVLLRVALLPKFLAVPVAAVAGALLFATAHHVGPYGEELRPYVFLFRAVAGLYFTALFVGRGFGVAVGAHAGYNVLVGVTVR